MPGPPTRNIQNLCRSHLCSLELCRRVLPGGSTFFGSGRFMITVGFHCELRVKGEGQDLGCRI